MAGDTFQGDREMIEAIQVAALEAAQQASPGAGVAQSPQASAYDIRQFAASLERSGGASPTQGSEAVLNAAAAKPSEGMRAVLSALDGLNGGAENINTMSQTMSANSEDLTPGQMMEMTMKCHQFLFKAELTSNVANRTSDGIQQLFRQQS
jgi:hypothetical protein